jgi:HAMP domain-containing protein/predicted Ser/Thr protein kinase
MGLALRIFLGIALVVVTVLVATLAVASTVASNNATASIQAGLDQTNARVFDILLGQRNTMLRLAQQFAANPEFRGLIDRVRTSKDSSGYATALDQALEADTAIGSTWAQITDPEGNLLARSDRPGQADVSLAESPLVSAALGGAAAQGFGITDSVYLAQAVAVPIHGAGGSMTGVLMAMRKIDDSLSAAIGKQTGSELVFYAVAPGKPPEISVSSPKLGARPALRGIIEHTMMDSASSSATPTDGGASAMMMAMGRPHEIEIAGTHYVGQRVGALSAGGTEVGGFIALRDKDSELAAFYKLRNALLAAGAGGLFLAFFLSLLISRQLVRPVQALVGATQRAADGDYNAEIPVTGNDEIGTLAEAFKRLLADLRDKQSLVDFLQSPSSGRTFALNADAPTLQMQAMGNAVLEPGQPFAIRYDIKSVLGVGGMGMVYKATDRELGEVLAIKTLKPDLMLQDPTALDRFKSEIRLARRIAHRNVVRTYDLGESGGVYFITMEYVEGKSLKELIVSRGKLPVAVVLPIAKQLCRALEVAHDEGIIHRDIKPQNMVVQSDGVLKVMDFGIARLARRTGGHTQAGMVVGTPEYMAPEQLLGDDIDTRADLYAVGVVLYECLTGRMPHEAESTMTLITKILSETPISPRELQSDIPAPLSDIVLRALSNDRENRPRSASELHDWLDRLG